MGAPIHGIRAFLATNQLKVKLLVTVTLTPSSMFSRFWSLDEGKQQLTSLLNFQLFGQEFQHY